MDSWLLLLSEFPSLAKLELECSLSLDACELHDYRIAQRTAWQSAMHPVLLFFASISCWVCRFSPGLFTLALHIMRTQWCKNLLNDYFMLEISCKYVFGQICRREPVIMCIIYSTLNSIPVFINQRNDKWSVGYGIIAFILFSKMLK